MEKKTKKIVPPSRAGAKAPKKKPFRLEIGKRYYRRDGAISGQLKANKRPGDNHEKYPFLDRFLSYAKDGSYFNTPTDADLVREVKGKK